MAEPSTSRAGARGRPPRVTSERLQQAILEIVGELPTMASLARQLGVGVATLYSHVRGQEELGRRVADVVFDAWELPPAPKGIHWADWLLEYARDARQLTERYPAAHGSRPLAGGQLRYVERVLSQLTTLGMSGSEALYAFHQVALLILGVGAQIEATRMEEAEAGLDSWGLFQDALSKHPGELPVLGGLEREGIPALDTAFDELVWFTLTGIARRRGEVLPTELPSSPWAGRAQFQLRQSGAKPAPLPNAGAPDPGPRVESDLRKLKGETMHPGAHAAKTPDKPAYVMARGGQTVTYQELDEKSNQGAQLFRSLGLQPGDHIALCMENNEQYFQICWAAQRSGLYYTCISSRLSAPEVAYIVDDCDAKVVITSKAKRDLTEGLAEACPKVVARYMVDDSDNGFENWEESIAGQPKTPIDDEIEGGQMLYSSGTTGRPKGVKHPLEMKPLGSPPPLALGIMGMYQANESSIYLSPAPLYHAAPLGFTMAFLRLGATVIVMENFDAAESLALIERHRATHSQWVPTMFVRMLKLPEGERAHHDVSSLTHAIHAAAPCPVPVKEQMIEWWGPVIHEYYAGTEGNGFCKIDSHEWLEHKGSVGKPLNAVVHILEEETEDELPTGEIGGVYFESNVKYEYHKSPEKTAEAKSKQGYTTLGDVGYVDEDGFLYLTDRKAFMIISGGVNIYPQETENCLITHPKVTDVAVIGVPNEDFGEEVKAVVQPANMADSGPELAQELIDWCKERIGSVKCPRSVDFVEELPRHPTGKLYKRLLKDQYWGKADSRIV